MNLNKVFIIGRLTQDPQLRTTPTGTSVGNFSVATNRVWTNKAGAKQEDTQFHNIVVWGRQAEIVNQFLKKGGLVMIEGRLQTRGWQDAKGQNHKTTEIICERVQLGPRSAGSGPTPSKSPEDFSQDSKETIPEINIDEGEIKPEEVPF